MNIDTALVGFGLIIIGTILQVIFSWNGRREIRKRSLIFINLGLAWLFVDSLVIKGSKINAIIFIIMLALGSILLSTISKTEITKKTAKKRRR